MNAVSSRLCGRFETAQLEAPMTPMLVFEVVIRFLQSSSGSTLVIRSTSVLWHVLGGFAGVVE